MLHYCFGIPGEEFSASKVEVRLVKLEEAAGADEHGLKSSLERCLWPLRRAALIRVPGPIGDEVKEAGRCKENRSGERAKSKGDNDMLQCVIIS